MIQELKLTEKEIALIVKQREEALTEEQKEQLALENEMQSDKEYTIKKFIEQQTNHKVSLLKKRDFLLQNGFIQGVNFEYELIEEEKEVPLSCGADYGGKNTKQSFNLTTNVVRGKCNLIYKWCSDKGVVTGNSASFDIEKNGISSYSIPYSRRVISAKTMLAKLNERNKQAENKSAGILNILNVLQQTINHYTTLYPNANITHESKWIRNEYNKHGGYTIELVTVKFNSGSYIKFEMQSEFGKETIYQKYDATFETLTKVELLNKFNNQ